MVCLWESAETCHSAALKLRVPGYLQVRRLQSTVRDRRATWEQSLSTLRAAKHAGVHVTKTSMMLGCGEEPQEVLDALQELRDNGEGGYTSSCFGLSDVCSSCSRSGLQASAFCQARPLLAKQELLLQG